MTPINRCKICHAVIQYAVGPTGKSVEVNPDGTDHSCQNSAPTNGTNTEPIVATTAAVNPPARMNGRPVIVEHETVIKNVAVRPDSIEIGTPGKGGVVKVYVDFADVADTEQRIRDAMEMRELANKLYSGEHVTTIHQAGKVHA